MNDINFEYRNNGDRSIMAIGCYNGWGHTDEDCNPSFFQRLYDYISLSKQGVVVFPIGESKYALPEFMGDSDLYPRVLWSYLVYQYGGYGTSPRYGWIDRENVDYILGMLKDNITTYLG